MTRTEALEMVTRAATRALAEGPMSTADYMQCGTMLYDLVILLRADAPVTQLFAVADELLVKVIRLVIDRKPPGVQT